LLRHRSEDSVAKITAGHNQILAAVVQAAIWNSSVIGAAIDVLERRDDVDARRIGVVGQSLGALYAPLAAAGEPRIRVCIANCGLYNLDRLLQKSPPPLQQEVFRAGSHARTAGA